VAPTFFGPPCRLRARLRPVAVIVEQFHPADRDSAAVDETRITTWGPLCTYAITHINLTRIYLCSNAVRYFPLSDSFFIFLHFRVAFSIRSGRLREVPHHMFWRRLAGDFLPPPKKKFLGDFHRFTVITGLLSAFRLNPFRLGGVIMEKTRCGLPKYLQH